MFAAMGFFVRDSSNLNNGRTHGAPYRGYGFVVDV